MQRVERADGRGGAGLYSQVPGNWIRMVTNNAPFVFFSDNGTGTNAIARLEANGSLWLAATTVSWAPTGASTSTRPSARCAR